jgi:carboxypeptidase Q
MSEPTIFTALVAASLLAAAPPGFDAATRQQAQKVRALSLADETAYELVHSLTTDVGPRLAGSPGDAKAVAWAVARLEALGFRNIRKEPVTVPHWERGALTVELLGDTPRSLVSASLGGSVGTDGRPLEGDVVAVPSIADLTALSRTQIAGRIVMFTARMPELMDGSGYARTVSIRTRGAAEAAELGALAVVIRSVGTDADTAHTGAMRYKDGVPRIPAVALANRDADRLEQDLDAGRPVRLRLTSTARSVGEAISYNVIGEIPGRTPELILLGAHLDSWDLGTGAHDDGAGVALVVSAARLVGSLDTPPHRTLRVVLFANEEFGLSGANAYAAAHADEIERHVLAIEADSGGGRVWGVASRLPVDRLRIPRAIAAELEPLGARYYHNEASGGADVGVLHDRGVPLLDLLQDGTRYFRFHHSAADTLEAIDRDELRQAAAAFAVTVYLAAASPEGFGRLPAKLQSTE